MKRNKYPYLIILFFVLLLAFCLYKSEKKENIYIVFEDLKGYNYQFMDSTDISNTTKVLITQKGKFYYEWWEIHIDTKKIKKADPKSINKLIMNSQFFIINNYRQIGKDENALKNYRLHIIRWGNGVPYILPVKSVNIVME